MRAFRAPARIGAPRSLAAQKRLARDDKTLAALPKSTNRFAQAALLVRQRFHARQLPAFEELQRRAAAGGDVSDLVGHAGGFDGSYTVAATDDGGCRAVVCYRLGNLRGALGESRYLED